MSTSPSTNTRYSMLAFGLVLLSGLVACSTRQGYASAQNWQRNQCVKIVDAQERLKCMRDTDTPYDQYKKDADGLQQKP
jgi:hypothetical protein